MVLLQIEHPVPSFEGWKQAFDSDPVGRQKSGVRQHQVLRSVDNPNFVIIELEFDTLAEAEALLAALKNLWRNVEGSVMTNPQYRIVEVVERVAYRASTPLPVCQPQAEQNAIYVGGIEPG